MIARFLRNSRVGHWVGLHSPSRLMLGSCWCQRKPSRSKYLPWR